MKRTFLIITLLLIGFKLSSTEIQVIEQIKTNFDNFISLTFNDNDNIYLALSRENKLIYKFNNDWNYIGSIDTNLLTSRKLKGISYDKNEDSYWFSDFLEGNKTILYKTNKDFILIDTVIAQLIPPATTNEVLDIDVNITSNTIWLVYNTNAIERGQPTAFQLNKSGDLISSFTIFNNYMGAAILASGICYDDNLNKLWVMAKFGRLFLYNISGISEEFIDLGFENNCVGLDYNKNISKLISFYYPGQNIANISPSTYEISLIPFGFFRHNKPEAIGIDQETGNFWSYSTKIPKMTEVSPTGELLRAFEPTGYGKHSGLTLNPERNSIWLSFSYVIISPMVPPIYHYFTDLYEYTKEGILRQKIEYYGSVQDQIISGNPMIVKGLTYDTQRRHLWAVDGYTTSVLEIDTSGTIVSEFSIAGLGATNPEGMAYDAGGDKLLIVDADTDRLYYVRKDGGLLREASISHITTEPLDICYEQQGIVWILDPQFAYRVDIRSALSASTPWQLYY